MSPEAAVVIVSTTFTARNCYLVLYDFLETLVLTPVFLPQAIAFRVCSSSSCSLLVFKTPVLFISDLKELFRHMYSVMKGDCS